MKRHFSMIRDFSVADLFTIANGFCGVAAILWCASYLQTGLAQRVWLAFAALPCAAAFDFLDGRVARWRHESSPFGAQLDSLADLISFGVAPAMLAFALGMDGGWDAVVLTYFVSCGLSRLARYNVTAAELADDSGAVRYFEGTPIPTSLALVGVLAALHFTERTSGALPFGSLRLGPWLLHPLVAMFALSGSAMISKTLRIPKP
jgi:CDP-diacylglycerol--serine O-phosphatidyltransferase